MDIVGEHLRQQRRATSRREPLRALHDAAAAPVHKAYAWLGSAAPAVQLQVLLLSASAIAGMADGSYTALVGGVLVCHLGHLLTLAGRKLARKDPADPWPHVLEQAVGRAADIGVMACLGLAAARGVAHRPGFLPPEWVPSTATALALAAAAAGSVLLLALLRSASDLHVLRAHLLRSRRVPGPTVLQSGNASPLTWNRERHLALVLAGTLLAQPAATLAAVAALHATASLAALGSFRTRLADPEPRGSAVLGRDYESP